MNFIITIPFHTLPHSLPHIDLLVSSLIIFCNNFTELHNNAPNINQWMESSSRVISLRSRWIFELITNSSWLPVGEGLEKSRRGGSGGQARGGAWGWGVGRGLVVRLQRQVYACGKSLLLRMGLLDGLKSDLICLLENLRGWSLRSLSLKDYWVFWRYLVTSLGELQLLPRSYDFLALLYCYSSIECLYFTSSSQTRFTCISLFFNSSSFMLHSASNLWESSLTPFSSFFRLSIISPYSYPYFADIYSYSSRLAISTFSSISISTLAIFCSMSKMCSCRSSISRLHSVWEASRARGERRESECFVFWEKERKLVLDILLCFICCWLFYSYSLIAFLCMEIVLSISPHRSLTSFSSSMFLSCAARHSCMTPIWLTCSASFCFHRSISSCIPFTFPCRKVSSSLRYCSFCSSSFPERSVCAQAQRCRAEQLPIMCRTPYSSSISSPWPWPSSRSSALLMGLAMQLLLFFSLLPSKQMGSSRSTQVFLLSLTPCTLNSPLEKSCCESEQFSSSTLSQGY